MPEIEITLKVNFNANSPAEKWRDAIKQGVLTVLKNSIHSKIDLSEKFPLSNKHIYRVERLSPRHHKTWKWKVSSFSQIGHVTPYNKDIETEGNFDKALEQLASTIACMEIEAIITQDKKHEAILNGVKAAGLADLSIEKMRYLPK